MGLPFKTADSVENTRLLRLLDQWNCYCKKTTLEHHGVLWMLQRPPGCRGHKTIVTIED